MLESWFSLVFTITPFFEATFSKQKRTEVEVMEDQLQSDKKKLTVLIMDTFNYKSCGTQILEDDNNTSLITV